MIQVQVYPTIIHTSAHTYLYTPAVSSSPGVWEAGDHWLGTVGRCACWTCWIMGFIPACPPGAVHGRQYSKRHLQQCTLHITHVSSTIILQWAERQGSSHRTLFDCDSQVLCKSFTICWYLSASLEKYSSCWKRSQ